MQINDIRRDTQDIFEQMENKYSASYNLNLIEYAIKSLSP